MIKNTVPIQRLQKGNAKWTLWPRTSYCMAPSWVDPTGCTSEPLTRFQRYANKKVGGPPPTLWPQRLPQTAPPPVSEKDSTVCSLRTTRIFGAATCTEIEWTIRQEFAP